MHPCSAPMQAFFLLLCLLLRLLASPVMYAFDGPGAFNDHCYALLLLRFELKAKDETKFREMQKSCKGKDPGAHVMSMTWPEFFGDHARCRWRSWAVLMLDILDAGRPPPGFQSPHTLTGYQGAAGGYDGVSATGAVHCVPGTRRRLPFR